MTKEELTQAYRTMLLIRGFEERLNELFLQGLVAGTTHLCIGQEACSVGVCSALSSDDCVFSNHRGHGHLLARGAEPGRVMAEIFGSPRGYAGGRGGSQHMAIKSINFLGTHGITAGTIPIATGAALHKKLQDEPGVAVVFFSDGAVGEGAFHESLNMAATWKLPVLFVCENNLYAMSTAHEKMSPVLDIAERAKAYNMAAVMADGNDVESVQSATAACRAEAEKGAPQLIELKTFRISGHSRGDKCLYRSREEEEDWAQRDPIDRCHTRLVDQYGWTDGDDKEQCAGVVAEIAAAENFAKEVDHA